MGAYITKRLLLIFPTLFGIMLINFALVQFVPGGPIEQILSQARILSYIWTHDFKRLQRRRLTIFEEQLLR